jgi:hypothetical protein
MNSLWIVYYGWSISPGKLKEKCLPLFKSRTNLICNIEKLDCPKLVLICFSKCLKIHWIVVLLLLPRLFTCPFCSN